MEENYIMLVLQTIRPYLHPCLQEMKTINEEILNE